MDSSSYICVNSLSISANGDNNLLKTTVKYVILAKLPNCTISEEINNMLQVDYTTSNLPNYSFLSNLLKEFPMLWIKNQWYQDGGISGIWIGQFVDEEEYIKEHLWDENNNRMFS